MISHTSSRRIGHSRLTSRLLADESPHNSTNSSVGLHIFRSLSFVCCLSLPSMRLYVDQSKGLWDFDALAPSTHNVICASLHESCSNFDKPIVHGYGQNSHMHQECFQLFLNAADGCTIVHVQCLFKLGQWEPVRRNHDF